MQGANHELLNEYLSTKATLRIPIYGIIQEIAADENLKPLRSSFGLLKKDEREIIDAVRGGKNVKVEIQERRSNHQFIQVASNFTPDVNARLKELMTKEKYEIISIEHNRGQIVKATRIESKKISK